MPLALCLVAPLATHASTLQVSTYGTFPSDLEALPIAAPGGTFALSFDIASQPVIDTSGAVTGVTNLHYSVNGVPYTRPIVSIKFAETDDISSLDICFQGDCIDGSPIDELFLASRRNPSTQARKRTQLSVREPISSP